MSAQPDTNTIAGKVAVMLAYQKGKRVEFSDADHRCVWQQRDNPCWDWMHNDYRIHPDDLDPPKFRPWKRGEVIVGTRLILKGSQNHQCLILEVLDDGLVMVGNRMSSPESLLEDFTLPDGSPCGVKVGE